MPDVARTSVAWVQPMARLPVAAASSRMAVAPLGAGRRRFATSSQMPRSFSTLAKWMPAVDCSGSGKWMASAPRSAVRSSAALPTAGGGSPLRTATAVWTVPIFFADRASTWPSRANPSIRARLRIMTSAGSPASRRACMAPTAPKVPSIAAPVVASNKDQQRFDQSLGRAAAQDPNDLHCTLMPACWITLAHFSVSARK